MATLNIGNPSTAATLEQRRAIADALMDPGYTWALRPTASGNTGKVIRITDVGFQACGSFWVSDGTNWNPVNGSVVLAQGSGAPGYPITSNTGATDFLFTLPAGPMVSGGSVVIPAGMIVPTMGQLEAECWVRRVGANGTASLRMYLGINDNASTDLNLGSTTLAATTNADANPGPLVTFPQALIAGTTAFLQRHSSTMTAAGYDAGASQINTAAVMYFNIGVFVANAADTFRLVAYRLTLKQ
jgi:hypothetical protein